jgi:hypothetical protein
VTRRWPLLACLAVVLAGCHPQPGVFGTVHPPACEDRGAPGSPTVLLEAQAVPSASLLPCIKVQPNGWNYGTFFAHNGLARFTLDSDREGKGAVTVILTPSCDLEGATLVAPDEPGTRRYERVGDLPSDGGYRGSTYYVFTGGCVVYELAFKGGNLAVPTTEVNLALGFISRAVIRKAVHDDSDGRLELDPRQ